GQAQDGYAMTDVRGDLDRTQIDIVGIESSLSKSMLQGKSTGVRCFAGHQDASGTRTDSFDHGIDAIAVTPGVFEPFEHNSRGALTDREIFGFRGHHDAEV